MTALLASDYPTLRPETVAWLSVAPNEDIADSYCEAYKGVHGIKARWVLNTVQTPAQWAADFVRLGHDYEEEEAREAAANAAFLDRVASLGLADWAASKGIRTEYDLMEYNYNNQVDIAA